MSMDDWGWDDGGTTEGLPKSAQILPQGTYIAEIRSAKWGRKEKVPEKWLSRNPEGCRVDLVLRVESDGVEHIFYDDVPRHWRWKFEVICEALDLPLPDSSDWQPTAWVGRRVEVDTDIWESPKGDKVDVKKYRKAPAKPQPAARRPNTGAAKVAAARGDEPGNGDDIPF